MKKTSKNIAVICKMDAFANAIRPKEIKKFLEKQGHTVTIISNGKVMDEDHAEKKTAPYNPYKLSVYATKLFDTYVTGDIYKLYFLRKLAINAVKIRQIIAQHNFDVLIFENHIDAFAAKGITNIPYILDLDSPLVDELYFSGKINSEGYKRLTDIYKDIYRRAKYINFQWHLYSDYIRKNVYNGNNFVEINFGCLQHPVGLKARYSSKPKIVCLGYLGGKWVNIPLLSKLSQKYEIDVYGGPPPDKKWKLNYKGYAPSTNILSNYQFGLITISEDALRKSSFSSKHLEYLSYGLPVLTPDWRYDRLLESTSIYYNESNFLDKIFEYSKKGKWKEMSEKSYLESKKYAWENILKSLAPLIESIEK